MHERVPLLEGVRLGAVKTIPANFALGWLCNVFERASIGNDDRTSCNANDPSTLPIAEALIHALA